MAQAAYNLCIITARDRIDEAVSWCRKASELRPQDANYAYILAFYLSQKDDKIEAMEILKSILEKYPRHHNAGTLLQELSRK